MQINLLKVYVLNTYLSKDEKEKKPPNYYKENGQKPQEYAQNYYWNLSQDKGVERKE